MSPLLHIILIVFFLNLAINCLAQTIERSVFSSSGEYNKTATASMSWTLGEIASETLESPGIRITQGFQQPDVLFVNLVINLKEYLGGPFIMNQMDNSLNTSGYLPLSQPYYNAPWSYNGTESVVSIPGSDIVDWVLIELRDAPSAIQANNSTQVARQAAFVKRNGEIVALDGSNYPVFNISISNQLFALVWHRNHLGVMSANALQNSGGVYSYDFTTSSTQVFGGILGHKQLSSSAWGMVSGDGNGDSNITNSDKLQVWRVQTGLSGYLNGDFNLNGQVNNDDKLNFWRPNSGYSAQIP